MNRRNTIIYWCVTIFLAFGMTAGGIQQLLQTGGYNEITTKLGYPLYFLTILGVWKILGTVALLIPKIPLIKEWAYAGFFFAMSGAAISHLAAGESFTESVPSLILLLTTILSWYFRPEGRKLTIQNNSTDEHTS